MICKAWRISSLNGNSAMKRNRTTARTDTVPKAYAEMTRDCLSARRAMKNKKCLDKHLFLLENQTLI
jgi:hypothetical protein